MEDGTYFAALVADAQNEKKADLLERLDHVTSKLETIQHIPEDSRSAALRLELAWLQRRELIRQEFTSLYDVLASRQHQLLSVWQQEVGVCLQQLRWLEEEQESVTAEVYQLSDQCVAAVQQTSAATFASTLPHLRHRFQQLEDRICRTACPDDCPPGWLTRPFSLYREKLHLDSCLRPETFSGLDIKAREPIRFVPHERLHERVRVDMLVVVPSTDKDLPPSCSLHFLVSVYRGFGGHRNTRAADGGHRNTKQSPVWSRVDMKAWDIVLNGSAEGYTLGAGCMYTVKVTPCFSSYKHGGVELTQGRTVTIAIVTGLSTSTWAKPDNAQKTLSARTGTARVQTGSCRPVCATSSLVSDLRGKLAKRESTMAALAALYKDMRKDLNDKKVTITTLRKNLDEKENVITSLREALDDTETTITSLRDDLQDRETTITSLRDDLQDRETTISSLNADLQNRETTIANLRDDLQNRETTISSLSDDLPDRETTTASFRDDLHNRETSLGDDIDGRKTTITSLRDDMDEKYTTITSLHDDIDERDITIASLHDDIDERDITINSLRDDIGDRETTITGLRDGMDDKEATITSLSDGIDDREATIASLRDDMENRDTTITGMRDDVDVRDTTITSPRDDVDNRQTTITSLREDFNNMEITIVSLSGSIAEGEVITPEQLPGDQDTTTTQTRLSTLRNKGAERDASLHTIPEEVAEAAVEISRAELKQEATQTVVEISKAELKQEATQTEHQQVQLSSLLQQIDAQNGVIRKLEKELKMQTSEEKKRQMETLKLHEEIIDKEVEIERLKEKLEEQRVRMEEQKKGECSLRKELSEKQAVNEKLKERVKTLVMQRDRYKEEASRGFSADRQMGTKCRSPAQVDGSLTELQTATTAQMDGSLTELQTATTRELERLLHLRQTLVRDLQDRVTKVPGGAGQAEEDSEAAETGS